MSVQGNIEACLVKPANALWSVLKAKVAACAAGMGLAGSGMRHVKP